MTFVLSSLGGRSCAKYLGSNHGPEGRPGEDLDKASVRVHVWAGCQGFI